MTMADRIVIMNKGRIEQVGTPAELYDRPINRFVAGFLGAPSMSFLSGRLTGEGADRAVRLRDDRIVPVLDAGESSAEVVVGIRPEAFEIDPDGPLHIAVEVIEPTGAELLVYGRIGGEAMRCVFRGRPPINVGETLRAKVAPDQIHLFDPQSGLRL